jgi:rhamnulokinase
LELPEPGFIFRGNFDGIAASGTEIYFEGWDVTRGDGNGTRHVAIDVGASTGRLVAGQLRDGRWAIEEIGRFRTPMVQDEATGYQCWEIDSIFAEVGAALYRFAARGPLASVGADSWGVDYVLLDARLRQVGKAVCYRDKRTNGVMERFLQHIPAEEIYRRTGIQFLSINTLYQLAAAVEQEPQWMEEARHLLMIPDYLHFRLAGVVSNEYTNATTSQVCGLDGQWDETLLRAAGVQRNLMQPPVQAATILGETCLNGQSVKVIAPATHDTASAVAGTPLESGEEIYISSGTWSLMGIESRTPIATHQALAMNFTNEGGLERRFRVLKNIMGMWLLQRICAENKVDDVAALVDQAAASPAFRSIVNPNDELFLNPASMTDALRAYCRQTGQPAPETLAQMARTVFDSLALSYVHVKEQLETLAGRKFTLIRIVGGGCQNRLLNQLCADACQLPVVAGPVEASALGNLSAQMIAMGGLDDLDAARALIRSSFTLKEFRPRFGFPESVYRNFQQLLLTGYQEGEKPT